jgi:hypothetical protein
VGVRHVAHVAAREGLPDYTKLMQRNVAGGGRIAVALDAGEPVPWNMFRPEEQVTVRWLHLRAPGAVFAFGAYTVRASRGHRLMTQLSRFAAASYLQQKFLRLCCAVEPSNKNSVRAHIYRGGPTGGVDHAAGLGRGPSLIVSDAGIACGVFNLSNKFVYTVR